MFLSVQKKWKKKGDNEDTQQKGVTITDVKIDELDTVERAPPTLHAVFLHDMRAVKPCAAAHTRALPTLHSLRSLRSLHSLHSPTRAPP